MLPSVPSSSSAIPLVGGDSDATGIAIEKSPRTARRSWPVPPPCCTVICERAQIVCPERRIRQPCSILQVAEQPSPDTLLPSSHSSPGSRTPSPQRGARVHVAVQPSPGVPFAAPSSHSSLHSTSPFPHRSMWHVGEQPSQPTVLPSSHSSPASSVPLPHVPSGARHVTPAIVSRIFALTTSPNTR